MQAVQPVVSSELKLTVTQALEHQPPSPTNYNNFEHEQNDHGRQCGPDAQRVASEEV
jgi:hypothetical protein